MSAETRQPARRNGIAAMFILLFSAVAMLARGGDALPPVAPLATPPDWSYPVNPRDFRPSPLPDVPLQVPGSRQRLRGSQLRDLFYAPDWHPQDHPPLPEVVSQGRRPALFACGYCHRANGAGGPENASLAGLPYDYIVQQMHDFRSGARRSSVAQRLPPKLMGELAQAISEPEIAAAAAYFSSLPARYRIKVVESRSVPATFVAGWFLARNDAAPRERIGQRIIEVPKNLALLEKRDSRAEFVAYVPVGSIRRGHGLVERAASSERTASAATPACTACHGPSLKGVSAIPGIAGRSPSYIFRQLYDIRSGARGGAAVEPMQAVVRALSPDDMLDIAAYLARLR